MKLPEGNPSNRDTIGLPWLSHYAMTGLSGKWLDYLRRETTSATTGLSGKWLDYLRREKTTAY